MADYVATHVTTANGGIGPFLYQLYKAIKDSGYFTFLEDPGWAGETSVAAGGYFVIESKQAFTTGKKWQALFCIGGAAVGGYADPTAYPWVLVDYLGTWDTAGKTFGSGASITDLATNGVRLDTYQPIGSYTVELHIANYSFPSPDDPAVTLDGILYISDVNAANTWLGGMFVGKLRSGDPSATDPYPFLWGAGEWTAQYMMTANWGGNVSDLALTGVSANTGGPVDALYNKGTTQQGGYPVEEIINIFDSATGTLKGILPLVYEGDRSLGVKVASKDGTRLLFNGVSIPV